MGGLARLAQGLGYRVTGSDANVYPPMSTQLEAAGIALCEGYGPEFLDQRPDLVVVGNALSRGNPAVEALLNSGIPYTSGPQWLGEHLLRGRHVLAVSGTHGKTTTSSMLAWILEYAGLAPGFLIGGVPGDFGVSARAGGGRFFVMEADEYDTAFFDKRSKFVHYRPMTLVIGNLEYDHADIFPDLAAIERQFHHLVRCVPGAGTIIRGPGEAIDRVLAMGVWSTVQSLGTPGDWQWQLDAPDGSAFRLHSGTTGAQVRWRHIGEHNVANAAAAAAAAAAVGVPLATSANALAAFAGVKRRLELRGSPGGVAVYDDFAHHPTAIATTLAGLRARGGNGRILAVIEPRSNTMRSGIHAPRLAASTRGADRVFWYQPAGLDWALERIVDTDADGVEVWSDLDGLVGAVASAAKPGDAIVIMSNGGFGGFHERLLATLGARD